MSKIRLEIDALAVETFETLAPREGGRGTVRGREFTTPWECPSVQTGYAGCPCENSGDSSCVYCLTNTMTDFGGCSWTRGDGEVCDQ